MTPGTWPAVLLASLLLWLAGCAHKPVEISAPTTHHWQLSGRLGYKTPEDGGSASIQWLQQGEHGKIHFSGPLGFGSAELTWGPHHASLQTRKDTVVATDPATLAHALTGLELPVSSLLWWLRGLPDPAFPLSNPEQNDQGAYQRFYQNNWTLTFDRHDTTRPAHYPGRIRAEKNSYRFVFVIQSWDTLPTP